LNGQALNPSIADATPARKRSLYKLEHHERQQAWQAFRVQTRKSPC